MEQSTRKEVQVIDDNLQALWAIAQKDEEIPKALEGLKEGPHVTTNPERVVVEPLRHRPNC
jgi:hypothetical protein